MPKAITGKGSSESWARWCCWHSCPVNLRIVGRYPPLATPVRSLPKKRRGGEGGQARSTQPSRSGRVRRRRETRCPSLGPSWEARRTPKRTPIQKTEPIQDPRCSGTGNTGAEVLFDHGETICSACKKKNVDTKQKLEFEIV